MERLACKLIGYGLVVGYSIALGMSINDGSPWKIVTTSILFTIAYLLGLFVLEISDYMEGE